MVDMRSHIGMRLAAPAARAFLTCMSVAAVSRPRTRQAYEYKKLIMAIIHRVLNPESCAVDIGSHRGLFLIPILAAAPSGRHLAIEPVSFLADKLKRRFPTIEVHAKACSDRVGTATFYLNQKQPGYSSLRLWKGGAIRVDSVESIEVPVTTLDQLISSQRAFRLIKIDAMGSHVEVLRGARATIMRDKPFVVFYARTPPGEDPHPSCDDTWLLLVEDYGLKISRLADWLAGRSALSYEMFRRSHGHHEGCEFCYVAHP